MFLRKKKKNGCDKQKDGRNSLEEEPEVDSEGYIIRKNNDDLPNNRKQLEKFYSSSDSSDSEAETEKKLHFEIKPKNGLKKNEPSLTELKETVKQLSISQSNVFSKRQFSMNSTASTIDDSALKRTTSQQLVKANSNSTESSASILTNNSALNSSFSNLSILTAAEPMNSTTLNETTNGQRASDLSLGMLMQNGNGVTNGNSINTLSGSPPFTNGNNSQNVTKTNGTTTAEDRYAALRAIFDDLGSCSTTTCPPLQPVPSDNSLLKSTALSKSISSFSVMGPPPPPSTTKPTNRKLPLVSGNGLPLNISRAESYSSLSTDMRMTPVSMGSSRGPSPLTNSNNIPIAVAIQESISARFKGSDETKCNSIIYGNLKIAFPAGILQMLTTNLTIPNLRFKLTKANRIAKIHCNKDLAVQLEESKTEFDEKIIYIELKMAGLIQALKQSHDLAPFARYYNVDILKYQLNRSVGASSCPLQVVTHWKCELQSTCLKIDYKYNGHALSIMEPLRNISFTAKVDANVLDLQSKPLANWNSSNKQICWKVDQISRKNEDFGIGTLRAKFSILSGPTSPSPVIIQMNCANTTFSGVQFELATNGYRVSLIKNQILTGRYISEADSTINYACV